MPLGLIGALIAIGQLVGNALGLIRDNVGAVIKFLLNSIHTLQGVLSRVVGALQRGFEATSKAVRHLLSDIVHLRLVHLFEDYERLTRKLKEWYRLHLGWLDAWKKAQERWIRETVLPVLNAIQRIRQVNNIFRIFGLDFAKDVDQALTKLEQKIIRNTLVLHKRVNELSTFLSLVMDPLQLVRRNPLFLQFRRGTDNLFKGLFGHGLVDFVGTRETGQRITKG